MKKLLLFICLLCCIQYSNSQDIVYDIKAGKFTDGIKKLKKDSTGDIYLKYYNPYLYTIDIATTTADATKKAPGFITNLLGINFGQNLGKLIPKTVRKALTTDSNLKANDSIQSFYKIYEEYLNTYISLKNKVLDVQNINIPKKSLLEAYFKLDNKVKIKFSNEQQQQITNLEILIKNLHKYIKDHPFSKIKIGSYKISGDLTTINIILTPRESAKEFATPLSIIKTKKVIKTDKKTHLWFSSGVMASNILKTDYYINSTSLNEHQIMTEERGKYLPGITTLLHVGFENKLKISFIIGGGVTIEGTPHVLIGSSFPVLESNYLSFNFGYGWAYIDTLSDKFSLSKVYTESPVIKTKKILSEKKFWFGLSYKL